MAPPDGDWIAVSDGPLPVADAVAWAQQPGCGAVVTFCGTVRDHSPGRAGVVSLEYEAYDEYVTEKMADTAVEARRRWPEIGRLALLHRLGVLATGDTAVVVVVSTPHRAAAFDAASFCIDAVKATAPIWKRETWVDGAAWVTDCRFEPAGS
jgi:molybdopterin synthase catalytic subunit